MHESALCFHHLEWPLPGARVAGPVLWLRGWVVGKPAHDFVDVRICSATGVHLGVLGLPRTDLAAHFKSARPWLPAEFVVGVPVTDGPATLAIEGQDSVGQWHLLQNLSLIIAADGEPSPREEGKLIPQTGGTWTVRGTHLPFHGHLDEPEEKPAIHHGRLTVFGWLLHETQAVRMLLATTDGLVFNTLESGLTDDSLATKVPEHMAARQARLRGGVDAPPTLTSPCCLRVYAQLADGTMHLCFAQRLMPERNLDRECFSVGASMLATPHTLSREQARSHNFKGMVIAEAASALPPLASDRPRRLLFILRTLQPDDATLRALDVARHLATQGRWVTRVAAAEDGPLRREFEAGGCPVQIVEPRAYFAATDSAIAETALASLGREIWWRHLNAVVIFDPLSIWACKLAEQHGIPVFDDPADSVTWFAPALALTRDGDGELIAPIRGRAEHGAGVLLHAADHLARHYPTLLDGRSILVTDVRDTREEARFQNDLAINSAALLTAETCPNKAAAVICPVFEGHPHRALLSAVVAGIPLITTPSPLLTATLGPNEVSYVPPGNPLALAHAIVDLLANPTATDRRTEAARRIVRDAHAPEVQLPRWEKLLAAALRG